MSKILLLIVISVLSAVTLGHHSTVTNFTQEIIEVDGVIEKIRFQNPHSSLLIKRPAEDNSDKDGVEYWLIETVARSSLEQRGITMDTLQVGSRVMVSGRKGRRSYTMYLRELIMEDGSTFSIGSTGE